VYLNINKAHPLGSVCTPWWINNNPTACPINKECVRVRECTAPVSATIAREWQSAINIKLRTINQNPKRRTRSTNKFKIGSLPVQFRYFDPRWTNLHKSMMSSRLVLKIHILINVLIRLMSSKEERYLMPLCFYSPLKQKLQLRYFKVLLLRI